MEISLILLSAVVWQSVGYTDSGPLALTDLAVSVVLLILMIALFCLFAWHFFVFARDRSKQLAKFWNDNEEHCIRWSILYCNDACLCCCSNAARRRSKRRTQERNQEDNDNDTELIAGASISTTGDSKRSDDTKYGDSRRGGDITPSESVDDISLFR